MPQEDDKLVGTVIWFSGGYGFIKPSYDLEAKDIFVHFSDIMMVEDGYKVLYKGQLVSYRIGTNKNGAPKAIDVSVLKQ